MNSLRSKWLGWRGGGAALIVVCVLFARGCPGTTPPVNRAPTADAGEDQVVDAGSSVTLDGSASSDPDGDPLSFSWAQRSGSAVSLSNASSAMTGFTAPENGTTLVFDLTVSDGQSQATASVNVSVRPVETSAQVTEMMQRSVTEDRAAMGEFPDDWLMDVGNDLPQQEAEAAELGEFIERFENFRLTSDVQEDLAPGATRTVSLEIAGASGLGGLAKWIGTIGPLDVSIALDGTTLVTGIPYEIGTDRGGSHVNVVTSGAGLATLSVTNPSDVTVKIRILFGATGL